MSHGGNVDPVPSTRREAREGAGDEENFDVKKFWFKEQQQLEGKGGQHSNAEPPPPAATGFLCSPR